MKWQRGQSASASEGIEIQSHSTQLETTMHHPAAGEMSQEEMVYLCSGSVHQVAAANFD